MNRQRGFLLAESMTALLLAILGVSIFCLIFGQGLQVKEQMEKKTDKALAQHILRQTNLPRVQIHDHIYRREGNHEEK